MENDPPEEISSMTIKSIHDLISYTDTIGAAYGPVVYRGQSVRGNLLPSIARANPHENTTDKERALIEQMQRVGVTRIPAHVTRTIDLLVLAQHFGMKTRLLDWTTNPLAALWFACAGNSKGKRRGDRYVYLLDAKDRFVPETPDFDPFDIDATKLIEPRLSNDRIVAQHGCFTVHRYSKRSQCFVPLERQSLAIKQLSEFVIPSRYIDSILASLDRVGINQSTLFPDLEGLCRYLTWRHESREFL